MTAQYAGYETPWQEIIPAQEPEPPERRCKRCGAVGTHYLTCARLRLPSGYRFSEDDRPAAASRRMASGPDHPDWPRPPRQ